MRAANIKLCSLNPVEEALIILNFIIVYRVMAVVYQYRNSTLRLVFGLTAAAIVRLYPVLEQLTSTRHFFVDSRIPSATGKDRKFNREAGNKKRIRTTICACRGTVPSDFHNPIDPHPPSVENG